MEGQQMNNSQRKGDLHGRPVVSFRNRRIPMNSSTLWVKYLLALFCVIGMALIPEPTQAEDLFTPIVGVWKVENADGTYVLRVDGSQHAVSAQEHFPIAEYSGIKDFHEGEILVRLKPLSGQSDQAGGIFFDRKQNGDYIVLRANALENNLNLYSYKAGRRVPIKEVGNAPAQAEKWHELKVVITGMSVKGYLDGALLLEHTLDSTVSGGIGLWSKDDSVTLFKDFHATASAE